VVRRARADDHDAVMAFATQTWGGWDYMPHAFPRWLDASDGVMLVGVVGQHGLLDADGRRLEQGQVVAIVRVAMPATGEAWLEGIRVDPKVRGMDVATDLQVAEFAWAVANGAHVIRYATSARNEGSHRLGARGGFERIVVFRGTSWRPPGTTDDDQGPSGFLPEVQAAAQQRRDALLDEMKVGGNIATDVDADRLWALIYADATFNQAARLYEPRPWALEELTERKFRDHVSGGEVVTVSAASGEAAAVLVRLVPPAEEATPRLAVLAGAPQAAFELLERVREAAGEPVRIRYPDGAPLVEEVRDLYQAAGYDFSDWALYIFGRPIDEAHPAPVMDPAALILEDEPRPLIKPIR